jgi:hypothetical protein
MALAVIVPVATVATWTVSDLSSHVSVVESERRGVQYLQPLTRLLGVLVTAQGAAVRGDAVDTAAVQAQIDAVEGAESEHGRDLSTRTRWPTLRDSIRELTQRPGAAGLEAYQRWSQAVDLTIALIRRVGDTSKLVLDSEFDSYYMVEAGLLRLPEVIQAAGQLADLLAVTATNRTPLDELRAAVMRDRIATASAAANNGLGKVVDLTGSGRISSALLSPLDQFGAATDALAPSVQVAIMPPLPENVPAAAIGVRDSAERLAQTVWTELDALLRSRVDDLSLRRTSILVAGLLGVIAGVLVGVLLWRSRRPGRTLGEPPAGRSVTPVPSSQYPGQPVVDPAVSAITGPPRAQAGVR